MLDIPSNNFIVPIVEGFAEYGCDVHVLYQDSKWEIDSYDFLLTYGPMRSMAWVVLRLSQSIQPPPMVVWFTEQVPSPQSNHIHYLAARARYFLEENVQRQVMLNWMYKKEPFLGYFKRMGRLRAFGEMLALKSHGLLKKIFVFTETNSLFLSHYGLPVAIVPMGYHPEFGERLDNLEKDIDVVFLGSLRDKRRNGIIRGLEKNLCSRGIRFVIYDGSPQTGYIFASERNQLLNRTKIMLNVMRQPWDDPVFRLLIAAPTGAMLLSEELLPTSTGPFQPGRHFAMADLTSMEETIHYYLSNESERREISGQAYEFVTEELTMKNMIRRILVTTGYSE